VVIRVGVQHVGEVKLAALREEFGPRHNSATERQKREHRLFSEMGALIPDHELRSHAS
jgi:hypothetical protein